MAKGRMTMLRALTALAVAGGAAFGGTYAAPALAQTAAAAPAAVIAFVDVPRVLRDSAAAKSARAQLERQQQTYDAELKQKEAQLRQGEQALGQQRATLSPEQFQAKQRELQQQLEQFRQLADRRRTQLAFGQDGAMRQMQPVLQQIVADTAKQVGATIVLDSARVLVSATNLNITDRVIQQFDRKLPRVTVNFNAPAQPAPAGQANPQ
ncbi:OmpH family outer membrane protein [Zavarzinia sp. CC-PAN008]|uniref:OmpH family outer membrane protein n=1 Tax=Zavarzinia sp. CC-PAN008 TaxID=3243332 RepID=UPI003F7487A0